VNRPLVYIDYDNLGAVTKTRVYDADGVTPTVTSGVPQPLSSSLLRAQMTTSYDELSRAYHSDTYSVDPSSGTVGSNTLHSDTWFDSRGNVVKQVAVGGLVSKAAYDGEGKTTASYLTDGGGDSGYSDADDVTGDTVLEQSEVSYDADGLPIATTSRQRFHDASGTGALGSPSSGIAARVSYSATYYDKGGRTTASVDVGTNGGSSWTRPGTVPSRSDTVLVSSVTFDAAGRTYEVTDPRGLVSRTLYDALGRTTTTIENYVNGTVSDADDKTTTYAYNAAGMTSLTANLTGGGVQTTEWVYGVTSGSGSGITSNDAVGATKWPDPTTGAASSSQQETTTVNALGQTLTATDRNGSTHTLTYDVLGRVVSDAVTTLGSGVDGAVRRIETAYDGQGNAYQVTSYSAASGGTVVNQVQRTFNGLGQMTTEYQEHGGAVNTSTSPKVQYAWSEMSGGANHSRLTSITYPSGYVLTYNYSTGLNDSVSRLSSLSDSTGSLEAYDYLGYGTVVKRAHSQPGVDLTFIGTAADAGDQYAGLDRFGRVVDQNWVKSGTSLDRFQYGYDRSSNRLWRDNLVNSAFGELYTYDGLNQVASFQRGTLNTGKTAITGTVARSQSFDFDAVGNFDGVTTNGTAQTRSANAQNEITSISGATTPTYDANGNMTGDETGKTLVYDAWNRLVAIKSGATTLKSYGYDAMNRRISETASGTTTDLYYSSQWQVLEEKVGSNTTKRYVWSPVYVDAMILRDRDTDANGTLDERLWVTQDANFNVTALVNGSGTVVERYGYDPFGAATVYDASYAVRSGGSSYDWQYLHQGGRLDSVSGLYHFRNRDYSPTLGRWVTLDPIGLGGGDINYYRALGNEPITWVDPFGLAVTIKSITVTDTGESQVYKAKSEQKQKANPWMAKLAIRSTQDTFSYQFEVTIKADVTCGDTIANSKIKQETFSIEHRLVTGTDLWRAMGKPTGGHDKGPQLVKDTAWKTYQALFSAGAKGGFKDADFDDLITQDGGLRTGKDGYFVAGKHDPDSDSPAVVGADTLVYYDSPGYNGILNAKRPNAGNDLFEFYDYYRITAEGTDGKKVVASFTLQMKGAPADGVIKSAPGFPKVNPVLPKTWL
jgi:RHS repeat-associated protein